MDVPSGSENQSLVKGAEIDDKRGEGDPEKECNGTNEEHKVDKSNLVEQIQGEETTSDSDHVGDAVDANIVDHDEDTDPIPSGTGSVSKDCSASELLGWSTILPKWHSKLNQRPKELNQLVRNGIPEPLRGEVWQLLSGAQQSADLMDKYRIFLTRSAPAEQIILRDVHRTYPAHENFRTGGSSSLLDSLFKVCKAYAVYDEEVGYCQGLSFLVAALLLHMPEEQAFCVFVRIMQHYGLRNLFRNNFDELYLKFYQLEHLLEDHMPDLHQHFATIGIEPFTYASQWFLTVFTAKFPLNAVFYIMDIFLLDGMNTIFQIALALLGSSKQELLALDFEGVLKYFRVQMPKRYRSQENVQQLINASSEISLKRLKKYAKSYEAVKQKEKLLENPVARLQRENAKLTENNLRLEQENDDLARDLVASKIQLRAQLDALEDETEELNRALVNSNQDCQGYQSTISDMEDEKIRLEIEVSQLKEVCRRELHRAESESARDNTIISDYKKICSQLSERLDAQLESINKFVETVLDTLKDNEQCDNRSCHDIFQIEAENFLQTLKYDGQQRSVSAADSVNSIKPNLQRKSSTDSERSNRPVGAYARSASSQPTSGEAKIEQLTKRIDELEVELARTKLALVEAECKCQQLTHELSVGVSFKKTVQSQSGGGLSSKLDSVKAAVTTRRSPKAASLAFAKINNLISEKISNMGALNLATPTKTNWSEFQSSANTITSSQPSGNCGEVSNSSKVTVEQYRNQC